LYDVRAGVFVWKVRDFSSKYSIGNLKPLILKCKVSYPVSCIDWSPCGKFIIAGFKGTGKLAVWSIDDPEKPFVFSSLGSSAIDVKFSSDGLYVSVSFKYNHLPLSFQLSDS
jgi:WD40 repeat protein